MYTIIGSDGAEYGPVSEAQVRAWVQAGRADGNTKVRRDGETEWTTIGDLPEFNGGSHLPTTEAIAAALAPSREFDPSSSAGEIAKAIFARGGRINIGDAFERSWATLKANFWPIVGVTFLITILEYAAQRLFTTGLGLDKMAASSDPVEVAKALSSTFALAIPLLAIVQMLLSSGLLYYYLKHLRGEKPTVGDAFRGFSHLGTIALAAILMMVFYWIGLICLILPVIYLAVAFVWTPMLIVDSKLTAFKAIEVSRRLITRQWFTMLGMLIISLLLLLAGLCALIIGLLVAMPLVSMAMAAAYESVVNPDRSV